MVAPNWYRLYGALPWSRGFPAGSNRSKCSLAFSASSRKKPKALPDTRLPPLFVTMLTRPPDALPNSAEYELARTWNSCTASWLNVARTPPVMMSLLSTPSTAMLLDRPRCPAKVRPDVALAPCCGVRSLFTAGVMTENARKLRPLVGSVSISRWGTTVDTAVRRISIAPDSARTVTSSEGPAICSVKSSSAA